MEIPLFADAAVGLNGVFALFRMDVDGTAVFFGEKLGAFASFVGEFFDQRFGEFVRGLARADILS
jgi:hypothetical protein